MTNWKNNRPPEWDAVEIARPIKQAEPLEIWVSQLDVDLVNAGANAMLESLKKEGIEYRNWMGQDAHHIARYVQQATKNPAEGWLVFIEEAQDENIKH